MTRKRNRVPLSGHPDYPEPADRRARYSERMAADGMVHVKVWIPEADRERLRNYAARLRRAALKAKRRP